MRSITSRALQGMLTLIPWALTITAITLEATGFGLIKGHVGKPLSLLLAAIHVVLIVALVKRVRVHLFNRSLNEYDQNFICAGMMFLLGSMCVFLVGSFL